MNKNRLNSSSFNHLHFMLLCLLAVIISSCSLSSTNPADSISVKELAFPKAENYDAVINTINGLTVLLVGGDRGDLQSYARETDQVFKRFNFPNDSSCDRVKYYAYETFLDGRLQVWEWCLTGTGGVEYLRSYDWDSKQLDRVAGPLPLGSSGVSWNPDQTQGIVYLDSGFATKTLYWLSNDGYKPLDLVISDGSRSWNLKDDFPDFKADDTGKTGSSGRAAWSPDGESIAFFASPEAVGKTSFERFGVEYYLYLMDPDTLELDLVAKKIYSRFLIQWSPDSTHIAFIGEYDFWKENGLWLYSLTDQSITSIAKGQFQGLAWTSNSNLTAIYCEDTDRCAQNFEYDLTSIVKP